MSLDPHWYSAIFGLQVGTAQVTAAMALAVLWLARGRRAGGDPNDLQDGGNLLLACVLLWSYLSLMQFLTIWIANLPHEIRWYLPRLQSNWRWLGLSLVLSHLLAVALLLFRWTKRHPRHLGLTAGLVLFAQVQFALWLTLPTLRPQSPRLEVSDLAIFLGVGALWLAGFLWHGAPLPAVPTPARSPAPANSGDVTSRGPREFPPRVEREPEQHHHRPEGHASSEIGAAVILKVAFGLALTLASVMLLLVLLPWDRQQGVVSVPPRTGPALLANPVASMADDRAAKLQRLQGYGWVDRERRNRPHSRGTGHRDPEQGHSPGIASLARGDAMSGAKPLSRIKILSELILWTCVCLGATQARAVPPNLFQQVGFDQHLGARLPLRVPFRDSAGRAVELGDYFGQRPVILVFGYFECPNLCGLIWQGLLESLRPLKLQAGRDFDLVAISIDPRESPELAGNKRAAYLREYGRPDAASGWHFLTGTEAAIRQVTDAAGFRYVHDPEIDQYAHASGLVVATPTGVLSRYLFGVRFSRTDLRLALVESSGGRIGSPIDQLLLLCYHYDPSTGRYGPLIMNLLRATGGLTVAGLLGFVVLSRRRERKGAATAPGKEAS